MTKSELLKIAKPILFNTEMVRAILDGRKTVTRRVVKPDVFPWFILDEMAEAYPTTDDCKYNIGDILYVRETWQYGFVEECSMEVWFEELPLNYTGEYLKALSSFIYKVGNDWIDDEVMSTVKWRPSIHMPKEAARIFLRVTNVRVERLREINTERQDDVLKEGIVCSGDRNPVNDFKALWNSTIHKQDLDKYGWEANPWVWVIEFERVEVNE